MNLRDKFYQIKEGLYNFWYYRKLIWHDRWWDHAFLTDMIETKLQNMIDHWDDSIYIGHQFTKKRMIILQKRIKEFDSRIMDLEYDYVVKKKYTLEEYKKEKKKLHNDTWGQFGKNIQRFWD